MKVQASQDLPARTEQALPQQSWQIMRGGRFWMHGAVQLTTQDGKVGHLYSYVTVVVMLLPLLAAGACLLGTCMPSCDQ